MIDDVYGDGGATGASGNGRSGRPSLQDNTPLPWRVKIIYGIGEIGIWCTAVIQGFFLTSFLLDTAGISAGYAGTILLIGQLFDSITNPIIGVVSDSCRTRIGRRRPWLLASAIPFGASFFGIFLTWSDGTQFTKFCYYLVLLVLFSTVGNMLATPYAALTSDLATTYDQSTELTQIRMLANIISGVIVSFTHSKIILAFTDPTTGYPDVAKGYAVAGLIWGIIFSIPPILVGIFIQERPFSDDDEDRMQSVIRGDTGASRVAANADAREDYLLLLKASDPSARTCCFKCKGVLSSVFGMFARVFGTLKNRAYLYVTLVFFFAWTCVQFLQNVMYLHTKYVTHLQDHFQWILLILQGVAAICLVGWSFLSARIGKKKVYFIGIGIWLAVACVMFWEDSSWPLVVHYLLAIPIGMGVSVVFLIPWSLIPDIIDQDEHDNGFRREGVFYSLFVLFQKIGVAVGISATSYVLQAVGYVSSTDGDPLDIQPDSVILALRVMFGPVPIVLLVLSLVFAWFYPLDREMVEDIRERLAERRALLANKNDNKSQSSSVRNSLYGASSEDVVL